LAETAALLATSWPGWLAETAALTGGGLAGMAETAAPCS